MKWGAVSQKVSTNCYFGVVTEMQCSKVDAIWERHQAKQMQSFTDGFLLRTNWHLWWSKYKLYWIQGFQMTTEFSTLAINIVMKFFAFTNDRVVIYLAIVLWTNRQLKSQYSSICFGSLCTKGIILASEI